MTELEYHKRPEVSNSFLGALNNPRYLKLKRENPELEDDEKSHFRLGSAIDCLLTAPDDFEGRFASIPLNRPKGLMGIFVDHLPKDLTPESELSDYEAAYSASKFKLALKTVVDRFWASPELIEYYQTRFEDRLKNKSVLGADEVTIAKKAVELIRASDYADSFFRKRGLLEEVLLQVPIFFSFEGVDCKALLDGVKIDHESKTIQPFDLKTIGKSIYSFADSYLAWGYYRQAAFYTIALFSEGSPVRRLIYEEGYSVLPFKFVVVEVKPSSTHPAVIFDVDERHLECGLRGGKVGTRRYKGVIELLKAYKWHIEHDKWDLPYDLYESNGVIKLSVFD